MTHIFTSCAAGSARSGSFSRCCSCWKRGCGTISSPSSRAPSISFPGAGSKSALARLIDAPAALGGAVRLRHSLHRHAAAEIPRSLFSRQAGNWLGAIGVLLLAKLLGLGVTAFIFDVTRDKLLQMAWFGRMFDWFMWARDWAHEQTEPMRQRAAAIGLAAEAAARRKISAPADAAAPPRLSQPRGVIAGLTPVSAKRGSGNAPRAAPTGRSR